MGMTAGSKGKVWAKDYNKQPTLNLFWNLYKLKNWLNLPFAIDKNNFFDF